MEKIVVFGLGKDFQCFKYQILNSYNVIACTDNVIIPEETFWKKCYIKPDSIIGIDFDKVLISSRKYKYAIAIQLLKLGVSEEKIEFIEFLINRKTLSNYQDIISDMKLYNQTNTEKKFNISDNLLYIIDNDKNTEAGNPCQHYFAQDIWGGRKVFENNPRVHYDIGSRLDGFIAHLLVFREVYYIDVRPLPYNIRGLHFIQGNASELEGIADESVESLSCFHALEHFGLGRYGDEIDPNAYKKAAENMKRVLMKNGHLYIGVPVGPENKLVFNAHRIFSIATVLSLFEEMTLQDMAIIKPNGVNAEEISIKEYQCVKEYSCGLFEFIKKSN